MIKAIEEEKAESSTKTGSTALSSAAASQKDGGEFQVDFEIEDLPMEGADNQWIRYPELLNILIKNQREADDS